MTVFVMLYSNAVPYRTDPMIVLEMDKTNESTGRTAAVAASTAILLGWA
jgi:hypothetical protein